MFSMILQPREEKSLGKTSDTFQYLCSLQESWKGMYEDTQWQDKGGWL